MNEMLETLGRSAKAAEIVLRNLDTAKKNQVLEAVADSLVADRLILILLQHLHGIPRQHLKECRTFWHPTMQTEHSLT